MHTVFTNLKSLSLLGLVTSSLGLSFECWDSDSDKRFDKAMKIWCKTIEDMEKDRKEVCGVYTDQARKERCYEDWSKVINEARGKKIAAAGAYIECDGETLDTIIDWFKKLGDVVSNLKSVVSSLASPQNDVPLLPEILVTTSLQGNRIAGTFGSGAVTYRLTAASTVSADWQNGLAETFAVSGGVRLNTTGLASGIPGMSKPVTLTAGNMTITHVSWPATILAKNPAVTLGSTVVFDGTHWNGTLYGSWISDGGSFVLALPIQIPAGGQTISLSTMGAVAADLIAPVEPEDLTDGIYSMSYDSEFKIGTTSTLHIDELDPGSASAIFMAAGLDAPSGTFLGLPWELDQATQFLFGQPTADGQGHITLPVAIPNDPSLVGSKLCTQGIATRNGQMLQTGASVGTIQ
jgi:hypothetical protein